MEPRSFPSRLFLASLLLVASAAVLANNMPGSSGSGSGQSNPQRGGGQGGGWIDLPPIPVGGENQGPTTGPEEQGLVPAPPSGPDQTDRLIDQVYKNGEHDTQKDENTYKQCDAIRQQINQLENAGSYTTQGYNNTATATQSKIDYDMAMSDQELNQQIQAAEMMLVMPGVHATAAINKRLAFLHQMQDARARYGTGQVYQNEMRGTDYYKSIADNREQAALYSRDVDAPKLEDLKAQYVDRNC